jgi:hypothetical protein
MLFEEPVCQVDVGEDRHEIRLALLRENDETLASVNLFGSRIAVSDRVFD